MALHDLLRPRHSKTLKTFPNFLLRIPECVELEGGAATWVKVLSKCLRPPSTRLDRYLDDLARPKSTFWSEIIYKYSPDTRFKPRAGVANRKMSMNSLFRRNNEPRRDDGADNDTDEDDQVDPELRLRTVRTAASTIAESIRSEQRMERRRIKRRRLWGSLKTKKPPSNAGHDSELRLEPAAGAAASTKPRRNIYVNCALSPHDMDGYGRPTHDYVRNKVKTSSESWLPSWDYELMHTFSKRVHPPHVCSQESLRTVSTSRKSLLPRACLHSR